jgi:predicted flap endonuclease-1-like 5' DNA nuclease
MDANLLTIVIALVVGVVVGGAIVWLVRGKRQSVDIARPSLGDIDLSPTLSRKPLPKKMTNEDILEALKRWNPPKANVEIKNPDNLLKLKGVGPRLAKGLYDMGIGHFSTIANWTPEDVSRVNSNLGPFAGRIEKDEWIEQAKFLAAGDLDGFRARYGTLGTEVPMEPLGPEARQWGLRA